MFLIFVLGFGISKAQNVEALKCTYQSVKIIDKDTSYSTYHTYYASGISLSVDSNDFSLGTYYNFNTNKYKYYVKYSNGKIEKRKGKLSKWNEKRIPIILKADSSLRFFDSNVKFNFTRKGNEKDGISAAIVDVYFDSTIKTGVPLNANGYINPVDNGLGILYTGMITTQVVQGKTINHIHKLLSKENVIIDRKKLELK